jgi:ABC-type nitrate/sulfonate/bicarbonate transport system ATPase subunit
VGYVFQEPRLMPWLDVRRNAGFGLAHLPRGRRDAAVAEALAVVGLTDAAGLLPKELSGGMAQRAALARALAARPALLLLDEPFSALDPLTRAQMQDHLLAVRRYYDPTMVLITHDMDEALALADRVLVLRGSPGRIVADVPLDLPTPRDRMGAAFLTLKRALTAALAEHEGGGGLTEKGRQAPSGTCRPTASQLIGADASTAAILAPSGLPRPVQASHPGPAAKSPLSPWVMSRSAAGVA